MDNLAENLDLWLTKSEVNQRTGMSERTIERKIQSGELRQEFRNIPGRKPITILHPEDVARFEARTLKPVPNGQLVHSTPQPDMTALMTAFLDSRSGIYLTDKYYLTPHEAAQVSGLPEGYLRRKLKNGELKGVKIPGWRIHREDLESFRAT